MEVRLGSQELLGLPEGTKAHFLPYTNGKAIRSGLIPCETNPTTGQLSYCQEPFHAQATITVGSSKGTLRHVCMECARRHHKNQEVRHGIKWD